MIYFIANEEQKIVKIGYTKENPSNRLYSIQVGNPYVLNIIGIMEGNVELERELHNTFKSMRLQGEWFSLNGIIENYIAEMQSKNIISKKYNTFFKQKEYLPQSSTEFTTIKILPIKPESLTWSDYGKFLNLIFLSDYQNRVAYANGRPIKRKELTSYIGFLNIKTLHAFLLRLQKLNMIDVQKIDDRKFIIINPEYASKLE